MASAKRPLSPHLSVYKWQIPMALSILHRGTGTFLSIGALFFSCWLLSIAVGPQTYLTLQNHIFAWYGQLLMMAVIFSFYYHLCNGLRHLFWDVGLGLDIKDAYRSAYAVIASSILLTAITFYISMGGLV